ncbi:AHR1 Adhesion and hyphal regulator 1 [Candida maltosa Xu316]
MAKKKLNPSIKRSRTRSGCVTCRDRHIKCDEQQPICRNCIKSNRKCYRGLRLNFTQYTFYDPDEKKSTKEDSTFPLPQLHTTTTTTIPHKKHRILDQSITIASLYNDTKNYKPYLHLHTPADLRESDLQFQEDTYNSYVSTSDRKSSSSSRNIAPPPSSLSVLNPITDNHALIKENSQIINQFTTNTPPVFNPEFFSNELYSTTNFPAAPLQSYSMPQLSFPPPPQPPPNPQPPPHSHSHSVPVPVQSLDYSHLTYPQQSPTPLKYDISNYIHLIETEKYYTLLDLTNDMEIWKTTVPNLCLKKSDKDAFLLDCLMSCSRQNMTDLPQLTATQLSKWTETKDILPSQDTITQFEQLLVSVTLIVYGVYLKITRDRLTDYHKVVLNNQAKLFTKIMEKVSLYIESNNHTTSMVMVNSIFSVTLLKFFINKNFDLSIDFRNRQHHHQNVNTSDEITYPATYFNPDLTHIVHLNQFEINYLNTGYTNLGIADPLNKTESQLFNDLLWYLIKVDFAMSHPESSSNLVIDYNAIHHIDTNASTLNQNRRYFSQRSFARSLMREFVNKLLNMNSSDIIREANQHLERLFNQIDESFMDPEAKSQFKHYFTWTLRYIHPMDN